MKAEVSEELGRALAVPISPSAAPVYDDINDQTKGYLGMGSS